MATSEKMDWSKIEKNVQFHTSARLQQRENSVPTARYVPSGDASGRGSSYFNNSNSGGALTNYGEDPDRRTSFYTESGRGEDKRSAPDDDDFGLSANSGPVSHSMLSNDIDDIKATILKQNEKIKALELALDRRDVALSITSKQQMIQDRMDRVEVDVQSCSKYIQSISQESAEMALQAKASSGRLSFVEDMYRSSAQEFVTKTTFSQLLTSCMDQLRDINTVAESARSSGVQSMQFVESFLAAISHLQSSQPSFSLEFLVGLSG